MLEDLPEWLWDREWQALTSRLLQDVRFMTAVTLNLAIHGQPHDWPTDRDDPLDQHPGELCACLHPVQDHECVDGIVTSCISCNCPQFTEEMAGWPPVL